MALLGKVTYACGDMKSFHWELRFFDLLLDTPLESWQKLPNFDFALLLHSKLSLGSLPKHTKYIDTFPSYETWSFEMLFCWYSPLQFASWSMAVAFEFGWKSFVLVRVCKAKAAVAFLLFLCAHPRWSSARAHESALDDAALVQPEMISGWKNHWEEFQRSNLTLKIHISLTSSIVCSSLSMTHDYISHGETLRLNGAQFNLMI